MILPTAISNHCAPMARTGTRAVLHSYPSRVITVEGGTVAAVVAAAAALGGLSGLSIMIQMAVMEGMAA